MAPGQKHRTTQDQEVVCKTWLHRITKTTRSYHEFEVHPFLKTLFIAING